MRSPVTCTPHCMLLTAWSRVLEKLTDSLLVKKLTAFYGTWRFITTFTSALQLYLSLARSILFHALTSHFLNINLNIILPSTPGSSEWAHSLRFPHKNPVWISPFPHDKCVPVTTALRVLRLRMEEQPPVWRVAVNILNKQSRTADNGWYFSLEIGRGANTSSP